MDNFAVTPLDIMMLLYMVAAVCVAWGLTIFGVVGFVLACMGEYSWKALGVLLIAFLVGSIFYLTKNIGGCAWVIACSPLIGLIMYLIDRHRIRTPKTVE